MNIHILSILVSIVHCSRVYKFLFWPQHPTGSAVGSPRRTSVAAAGTILIASVILKQPSLCSFPSSALLVLNLTLGYHTVAA
jgi:hypothetical protein